MRGAAGEEEGEEVGAQGPDAHSGNTAGVACESRARIIGNSPLTRAASGVGDGVEMGHEDTMLPLTMLSLGDISDAAAASLTRATGSLMGGCCSATGSTRLTTALGDREALVSAPTTRDDGDGVRRALADGTDDAIGEAKATGGLCRVVR